MLPALLIHSNGMPEIVQAERWGRDDVARLLRSDNVEAFQIDDRLLLWQVNDLDKEWPVNKGAEALVGDGNYFHLRGRCVVTPTRVHTGLSQADITSLTAKLAKQEGIR